MRMLANLEKQKDIWVALGISILFFLLRFPSLFEPNWYGDEGIYQTIGRAIRAGKLLYLDTWDNKPPTLYYLYAFFDSNQFQIRFFSLIIGILTLLTFFYLAKQLLKNTRSSLLATCLFLLLFGLPLLEGNIANAENFMLLPSTLSILLLYMNRQRVITYIHDTHRSLQTGYKQASPLLFLLGLIIGISFTIKTVAIFDFATVSFIVCCLLFSNRGGISSKIKNILSLYLPLIIGFLFPLSLYSIYFSFQGILPSFITSVFIGNVDYVGYQNTFIIPQGLLIIRTICLGLALIYLFYKRASYSLENTIIFSWLAFSLYSAFFSNRPYPHYLILLIPSFCLLVGYAYSYKKYYLLGITGILSLLAFFYFHVTWTKNPFTYYTNFISFITERKTTEQYQQYFDHNVPRDYAVAEYLRSLSRKKENVFIWGNSAQIYTLANKIPPTKYTVAYHIAYNKKAIEETTAVLQKVNPDFFVILPDEKGSPFSLSNYRYRISVKDTVIYERIH